MTLWKKGREKERGFGERKAAGLALAGWIAGNSRKIEKVFVAALVLSAVCIPFVNVNYDLTEYLPEYVDSKRGIDRMEETFGYPGTARIMLEDVSLYEAKQ